MKALHRLSIAVALVSAVWSGSGDAAPPVGPSDLGPLTLPYTTAFGNTFGDPSGFPVALPPTGPWSSTPFNFADSYTFSFGPPSSVSAFVATINLGDVLGIANFQAAVFPGIPLAAGSHIGSSGTTSGAVGGMGWTTSGSVITLTDPSLAGGQYTLEIRGLVTGTAGGSYSGVLNVSAVPEVSPLVMMIAGLAMVAAVVTGRQRLSNSTCSA